MKRSSACKVIVEVYCFFYKTLQQQKKCGLIREKPEAPLPHPATYSEPDYPWRIHIFLSAPSTTQLAVLTGEVHRLEALPFRTTAFEAGAVDIGASAAYSR